MTQPGLPAENISKELWPAWRDIVCIEVTGLTPCLASLHHHQYVGSFPVDDLDTQESVCLVQQQLWALQVRGSGSITQGWAP